MGNSKRLTNERTIVILQPGYLPWLGFFEQLYRSDIFVIYDDVQYDKNGWRNRNRIKTAQGVKWLTVPVTLENSKSFIKDIKINNSNNWRKKHIKTLEYNYRKSLYFNRYFYKFEEIIQKNWVYLIDLDLELIYWLADEIDIKREMLFASGLNAQGSKTGRLINICKKLKATKFYEGASGRDYIKLSDFEKQKIKVEFQNYIHPSYRQLHGEFMPYLSVIDLLFNEGKNSKRILTGVEK